MNNNPHIGLSRNWLVCKMRASAGVLPGRAVTRPAGRYSALCAGSAGYRRYQWVLSLVCTLGLTGPLLALPEQEPLPDVRFQNWRGFTAFETLADETTLAEYLGETRSPSATGYRLRVSFLPRFRCEPVVSVRVRLAVQDGDTAVQRSLSDIEPVAFRIDSESIDLPVVVDDEGDDGVIYFRAGTPMVRAVRNRMDTGNVAFLVTRSGEEASFSLFGSRRTLQATQQRCLQNEPDAA